MIEHSCLAVGVRRDVWEVLQPYGWVVVISFAVAVALTPILRAFALRFRVVDEPDQFLKPHARPIAYLGGIAIYLGWVAGMLILVVSHPAGQLWATGLILGGGVILLVGLADDLFSIRPWQKLLGQMLAAAALLVFGIGRHIWSISRVPVPDWAALPLSVVVTVFVVVAAANATNLLDGLDGLCSGVTGIISVCFLVLATYLATYADARTNDVVRVVASLAMAGAVSGFLPYNSRPATIFMGDAGSMLLGLYVAAMMLMFGETVTPAGRLTGNPRWVLGAVMMFGLPILDTSLALLRRLRLHRPIFTGDRSHFYDQLVDRGFTVRQTVAVCYALAAFYGAVGLAVMVLRIRYTVAVYPVVVAVTLYLCHRLGFLEPPVESARERADAGQLTGAAGRD